MERASVAGRLGRRARQVTATFEGYWASPEYETYSADDMHAIGLDRALTATRAETIDWSTISGRRDRFGATVPLSGD